MVKFVVSHAGAGSSPTDADGPRLASQLGLDALVAGGSALDAAVATTVSLEDDVRFNAGTGSNLRLDGKTIEMDASCMTSLGAFGAVAAIEGVKNPVRVAEQVANTPHILLAGKGATEFARRCGFENHDVSSPRAERRLAQIMATQGQGNLGEWSIEELRRAWNFETPLEEVLGCDTVGALAWDGSTFAGALSSGGTTAVLLGRVGDVPLPGCGLYVGPAGAVAATGDGEHIARAMLAHRAYLRIVEGLTPQEVASWAITELPVGADIGVIVADKTGFAAAARNEMAWSGCSTKSG